MVSRKILSPGNQERKILLDAIFLYFVNIPILIGWYLKDVVIQVPLIIMICLLH